MNLSSIDNFQPEPLMNEVQKADIIPSAQVSANAVLCAVKVKDYKCPKCGAFHNDTDGGYEVEGINYPKYFNEVEGGTMDGSYHDWDELHKCENCQTEYWFRNGAF